MSVVHYPALSYITDYDIYLFNRAPTSPCTIKWARTP